MAFCFWGRILEQHIKDALALIKRGSDELLVEAELVEKLKKGQPLRVKAGLTRRRRICIWATPC